MRNGVDTDGGVNTFTPAGVRAPQSIELGGFAVWGYWVSYRLGVRVLVSPFLPHRINKCTDHLPDTDPEVGNMGIDNL
jgi:hypothetical protein